MNLQISQPTLSSSGSPGGSYGGGVWGVFLSVDEKEGNPEHNSQFIAGHTKQTSMHTHSHPRGIQNYHLT